MPESSAPTNVVSNCNRFSISSMRILAFLILPVLMIHLPQPEAQNSHAHAEKKGQQPDNNVSQSRAAVKDACRRFKAGVVAGLDFHDNTGHGEGRTYEQHKARHHSGSHGNRIAPQPFLPLNFGDAPLCLRDALFITPHL